ncbi:unnamed protein product [Danaus chrysippus]|uniref:(African queen) hypothetical protein n=1 Tax=Danaus chrysippus TaxID=151541 RepID=A0A8J2VVN4_9NEOP|nr:unnamed protein product [Danaus chrysippus]
MNERKRVQLEGGGGVPRAITRLATSSELGVAARSGHLARRKNKARGAARPPRLLVPLSPQPLGRPASRGRDYPRHWPRREGCRSRRRSRPVV